MAIRAGRLTAPWADQACRFHHRTLPRLPNGFAGAVHADSADLAFEQLTLLVKESEGGRDLERNDIRAMLKIAIDVIVQCKRLEGRFRVTEIYYRAAAATKIARGDGQNC